jgi:hypothetical protein
MELAGTAIVFAVITVIFFGWARCQESPQKRGLTATA